MRTIVVAACLLFLVPSVFGQISIGEDDVRNFLDLRRTSVASEATDLTGAPALRDLVGPNQTWDITGIPFQIRDTSNADWFSSITGTIGESIPEFASANLVISGLDSDEGVSFQSTVYFSLSSAEWVHLGTVAVGEFAQVGVLDTLVVHNTPADILLAFPFMFGTVISDSVTSTVFAGETEISSTAVATDGEVDGWGTLVTAGGAIDVVRYRFEERSYDGGILDETLVYIEWWGKSGPVMDMELETTGAVNDLTFFDITVGEIPVSLDPTEKNEGFRLQSNYPNPFRSSTQISYSLPKPSDVAVAVFDVLGRQVRDLVSGTQPAGRYEVTFDATGLPSGVYFYRLNAGDYVETKRMVVVK